MASQSYPLWQSMTSDEQQFFKVLGARITQLRREQGLSQQALYKGFPKFSTTVVFLFHSICLIYFLSRRSCCVRR